MHPIKNKLKVIREYIIDNSDEHNALQRILSKYEKDFEDFMKLEDLIGQGYRPDMYHHMKFSEQIDQIVRTVNQIYNLVENNKIFTIDVILDTLLTPIESMNLNSKKLKGTL